MNKKRRILGFLATVAMVMVLSLTAFAVPKTANLVYWDGGDMNLLFHFDKEVVGITLISPDDVPYAYNDPSKVAVIQGERWAVYQVPNASKGQWKAEYDLGANTSIECSQVDENSGVWLQYVIVDNVDQNSNQIQVKFMATSQDTERFSYKIYGNSPLSGDVLLKDGSWDVDEPFSAEVSARYLTSGSYTVRVDVSYSKNGVEVFDSLASEPFDWTNKDTPKAIQDYLVDFNQTTRMCTVTWDEYRYDYDGFTLSVVDKDNPAEVLYEGTLEETSTQAMFAVPETTKTMVVNLQGWNNKLLSQDSKKEIPVSQGETLAITTPEITNAMQAELTYDVAQERDLFVTVNGSEPTQLRLTASGTLAFAIVDGQNLVRAYYEAQPGVTYSVEKEIYCDRVPPTLMLMEQLDGMRVLEDTVEILGTVLYGDSVTINDAEVTLGESGAFAHVQDLEPGKNVLTITAKDNNGNGTSQVVTVYSGLETAPVAGEIGEDPTPKAGPTGILGYWPLLATVLLTGLGLLVVLLVARKRNVQQTNGFSIWWIWALDTIALAFFGWALYSYLAYHAMVESLAFLDMADQNIQSAMDYLAQEAQINGNFLVAAILLAVVATATVVLCVVGHLRKKKK